MLLTIFCTVLASLWLTVTMTALCPMRAIQKRRQARELEDE
jgi:hypothetical protein